jgi:TolB-like protein
VQYVLEGSARKVDNQVRITDHLVDTVSALKEILAAGNGAP